MMGKMNLRNVEMRPYTNIHPRLLCLMVVIDEPLEFNEGVRGVLLVICVETHPTDGNNGFAETDRGRRPSNVSSDCRQEGRDNAMFPAGRLTQLR